MPEHSDNQNEFDFLDQLASDDIGSQRINRRTYRETLRWITFASLKALGPLVFVDPSNYPQSIILDNILLYNTLFPYFWVNPKQLNIGPLDETFQNNLGQKNGFFQAIRDWRPPSGVGALQLQTKYLVNYILDENNQYVCTVLNLIPITNSGGYFPYIPKIKPKPILIG